MFATAYYAGLVILSMGPTLSLDHCEKMILSMERSALARHEFHQDDVGYDLDFSKYEFKCEKTQQIIHS